MEGSKAFSKDFMARHRIPTAKFKVFKSSQIEEAIDYVRTCGHKVVLKASGLAGGKGVLIPETMGEALAGLNEIMVSKVFGNAGSSFATRFLNDDLNENFYPGSEIVIEELLVGPEISVLAFSDGYTIVALPAAQDHKRIGEGDTGLNTGGMGTYAPAPIATPEILEQIIKECLQPTINGMRKEGTQANTISYNLLIYRRQAFRSLEYSLPASCLLLQVPKYSNTTFGLEIPKQKP